ncbi:MAG: hypothetical protein GWN58_32860 [Anaerolineae bacterium]|nr:hypothetical protein [Thermoplasmata archaeon]NIV34066.1 hypothetical protein [Anaerolineae bacterium]NIY05917.1 hypothetical protein [Thermoplasmata archaeon]
MTKRPKIDELLAECSNPGTKAFLEGFKDCLEYAEHVCGGGRGELEDFAGEADSTARAKGRELGLDLLHHFIY